MAKQIARDHTSMTDTTLDSGGQEYRVWVHYNHLREFKKALWTLPGLPIAYPEKSGHFQQHFSIWLCPEELTILKLRVPTFGYSG